MFNFIRKLFGKKELNVNINGTSITEDDGLEFEKQLQTIIKPKTEEDKDVWIKYMFYLILKRLFSDMEYEVKSSFLTFIKLKFHKDVDYEFNKKGDFIRTTDLYTTIKRERDLENNIKIIKLNASDLDGVTTPKANMVYIDMMYTTLVEMKTDKEHSKRRYTAYKTPIRVYMIVDDDYVSMRTKEGLVEYSSIKFLRCGIILPEFASLNLQTKTIVDKNKSGYFLHEIRYSKSTQEIVSQLGLLRKRIMSDKSLDRYISEREIVESSEDNPFKEVFAKEDIFLNKLEEFDHLFKLVYNAKNTIFKLKDNEKFSTWSSCEKM